MQILNLHPAALKNVLLVYLFSVRMDIIPVLTLCSSCAIMYDNPLIQDHSCLLIIDKTPTVLYGVNTVRTKGISLLPLALARG